MKGWGFLNQQRKLQEIPEEFSLSFITAKQTKQNLLAEVQDISKSG